MLIIGGRGDSAGRLYYSAIVATQYNEPELVKSVANGNEVAFKRLYHLHYDNVYRCSKLFLGSRDKAREVAQVVFVRIWDYRTRLTDVSDFNAYLMVMLKNACKDLIKARAKQYAIEQEFATRQVHVAYDTDYGIRTTDFQAAYAYAVASMPARRKQVFQLAKEERLSYEEIASQFKISIFTVKEQLRIAGGYMKHRLQPFLVAISIILLSWPI